MHVCPAVRLHGNIMLVVSVQVHIGLHTSLARLSRLVACMPWVVVESEYDFGLGNVLV
jgi:hypothetical protein